MNDEQTEVYCLVAEFARRQELVHDVLRQHRPHLVPTPGERPPRPSKEQATATQRGRWGEWQYRIHGGGCSLVHQATGEPIQWDSPELRRFDPSLFMDWLTWRAAKGSCSIDLREVPRILAELARLGVLIHDPDRTNAYEVRADDGT
jgi:hypothetical protein